MTLSVLIVCLGNICRSPMGEAVLRHIASERGVELTIDSCGTGAYHIGSLADPRQVIGVVVWDVISQTEILEHDVPALGFPLQHGISIDVPLKDGPRGGQPHKARVVETDDFTKFDHILAADGSNLRNLERIKPDNCTADVRLWGSYLDNKPISDPYYDSEEVRIQQPSGSRVF
ncbi:hypothetical protein HWV62_6501 [Athelia sp. TMB]|nr:hypothetical protein HWV62_6501 [Athelia sp. TMB]